MTTLVFLLDSDGTFQDFKVPSRLLTPVVREEIVESSGEHWRLFYPPSDVKELRARCPHMAKLDQKITKLTKDEKLTTRFDGAITMYTYKYFKTYMSMFLD